MENTQNDPNNNGKGSLALISFVIAVIIVLIAVKMLMN